jgi:O-methyltransferase involved in polyketide biosynthesis
VARPSSRLDGNVLDGVSTTTLWTLYYRASEAKRSDGVIRDPWAVTLFDAIDYDYRKFGRPNQSHALRAVTFDREARRYLRTHPKAAVVALAEGLQTSFWRLDAAIPDAQFPWLTVDFPEIVDLRTRLLPVSPRASTRAQSALDYSWMDSVDPSSGVFITAEGLLMYLQPEQAMGLIRQCAKKFPGGRMMFDLPPTLFARMGRRGLRTSRRYRVPPLSFSLSASEAAALADIPGVRAVYDLRLPPGRGRLFNAWVSLIYRANFLRALRPCLTLLEFG